MAYIAALFEHKPTLFDSRSHRTTRKTTPISSHTFSLLRSHTRHSHDSTSASTIQLLADPPSWIRPLTSQRAPDRELGASHDTTTNQSNSEPPALLSLYTNRQPTCASISPTHPTPPPLCLQPDQNPTSSNSSSTTNIKRTANVCALKSKFI